MRIRTLLLPAAAVLGLAACGDRYSPDVYATRAVQQADKVEQGVIVGVRPVRVSAEGTTGAATGAAAGGVLGAQAPGGGIISALGGVGGALIGGIIGKGAEHTVVDTNAFEYIVRTHRNGLMRVTQQDREPLQTGQQVLLIMGTQARIVPDYTVQPAGPSTPSTPPEPSAPEPGPAQRVGPPETGALEAAVGAATRSMLPEGSAAAHAASALLPPTPAYPAIPPAPPPPRAVDTPVTGG